jgi:DNA-binding LacI/PurR family transcriptional regulator
VRRAVTQLIEEAVLRRNERGQLEPALSDRERANQSYQALLLSPVRGGLAAYHWQEGVSEGVRLSGGLLRVQHFLDEDDPALLAALGQDFDIIFFIPPDRFSEVLRNRLKQVRERIFTLYRDLTQDGLSMISDVSPTAVVTLLDHLREAGHRIIDCVHCHTGYAEYAKRIAIWEAYLSEHGLHGQLWDCSSSPERGEQRKVVSIMRNALSEGRSSASALLGLSVITGWGLIRAAADAQLVVPEDLSIAVFGPSELSALTVPSLTGLQQPAISEMTRRAVMVFQNEGLGGVRIIEPDRVGLFRGESSNRSAPQSSSGQ